MNLYRGIHIRQEEESDYREVYTLIQAAFASAEHADGKEQDLVERLRKGNQFIPELSLVAEMDRQIVGHILFTEAMVNTNMVLALAPLSVHPSFQRQGIGATLIQSGHKQAMAMGYPCSIVLGNPKYYGRFGYTAAKEFGILSPFEVPDCYFMCHPFQTLNRTFYGTLQYAKEFGIGY